VDSGTVVAVLVKEGDSVAAGQGIIEIETGKAVAPVPAASAGKVAKVLVAVGDKISVGQSLVSLDGAGAASSASAPGTRRVTPRLSPVMAIAVPAPIPEEPELTIAEIPEEDEEGLMPPPAAPSIRRIARELGINLRRIRGTERGGRIVMQDLRDYIARLERLAHGKAASAKPAPSPAEAPAPAPAPVERIDFSKWGPVTAKPLSQLRKVIAQRMLSSSQNIPHVTQFDEADTTRASALRKQYAEAFDKKGARLTLTSFALKIVAQTLKKYPIFNASLDEAAQEIIFKDYIHIGLAVDTEQGLVVPVIRDVDKKDLATLSREVAEFAVKARERRIGLDEMQGGTFTISNQGGIGGAHFTPIINRPEVAILGMGRGGLKPAVREGRIEPREALPLALSYDHRLIDGGAAARFMVELVRGFEQFPEELLTF